MAKFEVRNSYYLSEEETEQGIEEILKEGEGTGIISSKEDSLSMVHSEAGVIPRNDLRNAYTVKYDAINSKEYHDKFMGMTDNRIVDEAIYKKTIEFLDHRNGTPFEDIAMLSSRTGRLLEQNKKCDIEFKCWITDKQAHNLEAMGKRFEIIHNHPGNTLPSVDDIKWLYLRELADASNVVAHDGSVYRMVKLKTFDDIEKWLEDAVLIVKKEYAGTPNDFIDRKSSEVIIEALQQKGYMKYIKR